MAGLKSSVNPSSVPMKGIRPRSVTVLGATGSVGCNTVDLLARNPEQFELEALSAGKNWKLLAEQALKLGAKVAVIGDEAALPDLKSALAGSSVEAAAGESALIEAAARPSDVVVAAIVGAAGLKPTLEAVRRGATVALANKECLVSAGEVVQGEVAKSGATLLPVDSEHSAIFQVFDFENPETVAGITLTASGGPFLNRSLEEMADVTPEQAVAHPNWDMGAKISVDSATMMNKGLELIEAFHLFPVDVDAIEVLVHPQSVVHSLVSYVDGSVLAQLGTPDMRTPIAVALAWPSRMKTPAERLSLSDIGRLDFQAPDETRFPALRLAREALQAGGSAPTILNAANEVAVAAFLGGAIGFLQIAQTVEKVLDCLPSGPMGGLDDVMAVDKQARVQAQSFVGRLDS